MDPLDNATLKYETKDITHLLFVKFIMVHSS